jgi:signal transduction histidine kinase
MTAQEGILAALTAGVSAAWLVRERRARAERRNVRGMFGLGEAILGASSPKEILGRVARVVPEVLGRVEVRLYLYDRPGRSLDRVLEKPEDEGESISVESPRGLVQRGVAVSFKDRALLEIRDTRLSPFAEDDSELVELTPPRALLFVPMFAQEEVLGVLEIRDNERARAFCPDGSAVAQHLANQMALAIRLLRQRSMQEKLSRSEKLAAVGRLVAGVVNDLQEPLCEIAGMAERELQKGAGTDAELRRMAKEARKAEGIVTRLVAFARAGQEEYAPVDINRVLRGLVEYREQEWSARGILVNPAIGPYPLFVMGGEGQLEQVLLNLLLYAEQALPDAGAKRIGIRTASLARRTFIDIEFPCAEGGGDPFAAGAEGSALGVCRSIVAGHGGEVTLTRKESGAAAFEVALPSAPDDAPSGALPIREGRTAPRGLTALLIEPDETVQGRLMTLLSARGYRVVPVRGAEQGIDMAERMRFDVAFGAARLPGRNAEEAYASLRGQVGAFVLIADARVMGDGTGGRFVLTKPVEEDLLDRTIADVENYLRQSPMAHV